MTCIGRNELKVEFLGWWDGSVGKGTCCYTCQPKFNSQPHGEEREMLGLSSDLYVCAVAQIASPQTPDTQNK